MKRITLFILVLCLCGIAQAQVGVGYYRSGYGVQKVKKQNLGPLTRDGKIYYYHGKPMKEAEMVQLLNENCTEAYNYYKKQQRIANAGWGLFGAGIGMVILGGGLLGGSGAINTDVYPAGSAERDRMYDKQNNLLASGIAFMCGGAVITGGIGMPMIIAGYAQKRNAHKVYNTWCGYKELEQETSQLEFRLQSSHNGLGLALVF